MKKPAFSSRVVPIYLSIIMVFLSVLACSGGASSSAPESTDMPAPAATDQSVSPPPAEDSPTDPAPEPALPQPAINETRRLTLEFPAKMRAGVEGDIVMLTLEVDESGNITPTAQIEGNTVIGETIEIPDLYETNNVTAEARLDLAGMDVQPSGVIYEPLKRGQSARFFWSIRPLEPGVYRGTVWLHLNFTDKSTGASDRIPLSAQIIEIEAVDFFGLSVNFARTSGVVGSIVGGVVGFPFIEDILKFIFRRRKKS